MLYKKNSIKYLTIYLFFVSWLMLGILFHLQIFPLDQTVADRWFYFPAVGLLGMAGVMLEAFKIRLMNKWITAVILIMLIVLSAKTFIRGLDFEDNMTLYTHDVMTSDDSFSLESVLGLELMKQRKLSQAKVHLERSVALYPYFSNLDNLGELYVGLGDYQKAKDAYLNALRYGDYYIVYEDLGGLTLVSGDYQDNLRIIEQGLKKFPNDSKLWLYLAIISYENKNVNLAKQAVVNAYVLDKTDPEIPGVYNAIMQNRPLNLHVLRLPK